MKLLVDDPAFSLEVARLVAGRFWLRVALTDGWSWSDVMLRVELNGSVSVIGGSGPLANVPLESVRAIQVTGLAV